MNWNGTACGRTPLTQLVDGPVHKRARARQHFWCRSTRSRLASGSFLNWFNSSFEIEIGPRVTVSNWSSTEYTARDLQTILTCFAFARRHCPIEC
mmetsp:Transcript_26955/g.85737  ORF Transcript_26955/g.85737 Transcript_26955/m.85737 type:complete len:95 (-) Transcript_26955:1445-1729(-)